MVRVFEYFLALHLHNEKKKKTFGTGVYFSTFVQIVAAFME